MAYFANNSEAERFENQCGVCRFGQMPCPIAMVHLAHNYEQVGNELATTILAMLVSDDGTCQMFDLEPAWFIGD